MQIKELIKRAGISSPGDYQYDFEVRGVSCNSGEVKDNFVFIAIKGNRRDGSDFIEEAIQRGAKAVIMQRARDFHPHNNVSFIAVDDARAAAADLAAAFYGHPSSKMKVAGITGTNGKTTVSYLLEAITRENGLEPAVIGTINYRFKDKVFPSRNTTPGPTELHSLLKNMLDAGVTHVFLEVSSHALDQARHGGIDFHSAIFTNLTQDHLDYHLNMDNYFDAKSRLFKVMPRGSFAVINNDSDYAGRLAELTRARVVTYGITSDADVTADDIKFNIGYTKFSVITACGKTPLTSRLIGKHNVYNILAVVAWALEEGVDMPVIKSAIEKLRLVPGRLERIDTGSNLSVFVDYAHTHDALQNVITTLRELPHNRIIVVFGCGGERDKSKRPRMGKVVSELADYAIITSDNPRSEDPDAIISDIRQGINKRNYSVIPDRAGAIREALEMAEAGDIVLVAGKGHEDYQVLKDETVRFDDREVIRGCLKSASC